MLILLSLWAFGEASFWFVAPDFLLIPLSLQKPRNWFKLSLIAWVSSIGGGLFYFWWASKNPELAQTVLSQTPFVSSRMQESISNLYQKYGFWGALFQSWSFMSFKIWTWEAIRADLNFWGYFPVVVFSRIFRLFVVTYGAARLSPWLLPIWNRRPVLSWILYATLFISGLILIEK